MIGHTIPVGVAIDSGTDINFEYTVESVATGGSTFIGGWLWEVKYRLVGETEWTVATSGKVYQEGGNTAWEIDNGDQYTVYGSFTAPAKGNYELLINCYNVHRTDPGPAP